MLIALDAFHVEEISTAPDTVALMFMSGRISPKKYWLLLLVDGYR